MSNQLTWGPWESYNATTPYIHWWKQVSRPYGQSKSQYEPSGRLELISKTPVYEYSSDNDALGTPLVVVPEAPIPNFARNPGFENVLGDWLPDEVDLPEVALDTVIVGVIDTGIPLGHSRWRHPDGSSRVLASWQQAAPWSEEMQSTPPFGRAFLKGEIEERLNDHSGGKLDGLLDEEAFNRETGVVDIINPIGSREAAQRHSHGAHVLDAAAGIDPGGDDEFRDRVAIITVNLPGSAVFGESGTYLDGLMMYATGWISQMADAIWRKARRKQDPDWSPESAPQEKTGFPTVINISFGKQAGSKTSLDPFGATLQWYLDHRKDNNRRVTDIVMPVGNDNLARCFALTTIENNGADQLTLRVQPEDQSASFVEVWTELCAIPEDTGSVSQSAMQLCVSPPGGEVDDFSMPGEPGQVRYLKRNHEFGAEEPSAAIYYDAVSGVTENTCRERHLLCIAPSLRQGGRGEEAPSGAWKLLLKNRTARGLKTFSSVQTDQAILSGRTTARRAYFDDEYYQRVDGSGRPIGSYEANSPLGTWPKNTDLEAVLLGAKVRRHGTMNSTVASRTITCVAGHRASDGTPALYSSTGRGRWDGADDGGGDEYLVKNDKLRRGPTASLPTDDGPAHFGTLAAGAANGSVVAMQGTSFASAQAARIIAQTLLVKPDTADSGNKRLYFIAKSDENNPVSASPGPSDIDVRGGGRARSRSDAKVARTDRIGELPRGEIPSVS